MAAIILLLWRYWRGTAKAQGAGWEKVGVLLKVWTTVSKCYVGHRDASANQSAQVALLHSCFQATRLICLA